MNEIWKDIPGFEGIYQASTKGRIKSLDRTVHFIYNGKEKTKFFKGKILNFRIGNTGYYRIKLCKNGTAKYCFVHRLVASTFLDNPYNLPQVNHKDGNRLNNNIDNLEWVTMSENVRHAYNTGLNHGLRGDLSPHKRAVLQYDKDGNFIKRWSCYADAARSLNCAHSNIYAVCSHKKKTCAGFIWKYEDEQ